MPKKRNLSSSPRIETLLSFLRPNATLYDLCCDHGLIGLKGLTEYICKSVVFIDQSEHALAAVRNSVFQLTSPLQNKTKIICAAAEDCTIDSEPSDIIIAGVGIQTTISIINHLFPKDLSPHRLILAPQQKSQPLRAYLHQRGFGLIDETVLVENKRFREIIVVEQNGETIDAMGSRIEQRMDAESQAYVRYLKTYYDKIQKQR